MRKDLQLLLEKKQIFLIVSHKDRDILLSAGVLILKRKPNTQAHLLRNNTVRM